MNITLHLTNRCTLSCKYCYVDKKIPRYAMDTAKKPLIWLLICLVKGRSIIFGGEPLLKRI